MLVSVNSFVVARDSLLISIFGGNPVAELHMFCIGRIKRVLASKL